MAPPRRRSPARRATVGRFALQILVSGALIALLLWWVNARLLIHELQRVDWRLVVLATLLIGASKAVHGVRWWLLLRGVAHVPLGATMLLVLAATGVSLVLPFRAGAAMQVQVMRRRYGVERASAPTSSGSAGCSSPSGRALTRRPPSRW